MYCAKCGVEIADKLNYCNSCGEKLTVEKEDSTQRILVSLIVSLSVISIVGLILIAVLIAQLFNKGIDNSSVIFLGSSFLLTLFGITFTIGRQISKLIDSKLDKKISTTEVVQPPILSMPKTPQLNQYQQPISSVTEHTTQTLEEVFVKRN